MKKSVIAGAAGAAVIGAAGLWAVAQQADRTAGDKLQADLEKQAVTRPAADAPPVGEPAEEVADGEINWTQMQTELALTKRREVTAEQQYDPQRRAAAAATARPAGMRAAAADQYEYVEVREVNVTRLPLLVPEGERIRQTLKIYSQGDTYSAVAEVEDGVSMRMSGARKKIVVGDEKSAQARIKAMRADQEMLASVDAPYLIARSDSSTDLSFSKFGAGYVLSIMCDDPADPRCAEDAFIINLASNFSLLNPEAGGQ